MSTSKWKPYPEYKSSKSKFIGKIPNHWGTKPLKGIIDQRRPITYGIVQCGPKLDSGIPYIRPADMTDEGGVEIDNIQYTSQEIAAPYARSTIKEGDLVVSIGPSYGKVMTVPAELEGGNLTQGTARIAINENNFPDYFFWTMRSDNVLEQWNSSVQGATFRALNLEPLANSIVPLPPKNEQLKISKIIRKITKNIDSSILVLKQQMNQFEEKRSALITQAVTKGLNPDVAMKDSGINYIGEIPENWNVYSLGKICSKIQNGVTPPTSNIKYYQNGDLPWYGPSSFSDDIKIGNPVKMISKLSLDEGVARKFSANSVMIIGIGATLGKSCFVDHPASCNQQITVLKIPSSKANTKFIAYQMKARERYLSEIAPNTTLPQMNNTEIRKIFNTLPSLIEQNEIVRYIDLKCSIINNLIIVVSEQIEKIQEYRTALISAAVTGKIDVRGLE